MQSPLLFAIIHHVVHAHMAQGIRIACTGTVGRVIREPEAIAASDVYHQPMIQTRRREALLKGQRIAYRERLVAVVKIRHDVSL